MESQEGTNCSQRHELELGSRSRSYTCRGLTEFAERNGQQVYAFIELSEFTQQYIYAIILLSHWKWSIFEEYELTYYANPHEMMAYAQQNKITTWRMGLFNLHTFCCSAAECLKANKCHHWFHSLKFKSAVCYSLWLLFTTWCYIGPLQYPGISLQYE